MRIVVALGGNALLHGGEPLTAENQIRNIRMAAKALAPLCLAGHQLVITHGIGPQVGLQAMQAAATPDTPYPLEILDTRTAGMPGYLIEQQLINILPDGTLIAAILMQVRVERDDPAFRLPTRPVGALYDESEARTLAAERGWRVAGDARGWRRVIAAPQPRQILEAGIIEMLLARRVIVICTGGGIPVVELEDGSLAGVDAMIENDHASALLAQQLQADWLVLLTDVDALYENWGTGRARALHRATPVQLADRSFAPGSMGPKVSAACSFVEQTGRRAGIGALRDIDAILAGSAGTIIETGRASGDGQRVSGAWPFQGPVS